MKTKLLQEDIQQREAEILQAAQWCFLNFGFRKTSLEDIAKRAGLSRTLLYKHFKDKEEIFIEVFVRWLVARQPEAVEVAKSTLPKTERLMTVCQLLIIEPWADMVSAPMAAEFYDMSERLNADIVSHHRQTALLCVVEVLRDEEAAKVFLSALDGLLIDKPSVEVLTRRTQLLVDRFVNIDPS